GTAVAVARIALGLAGREHHLGHLGAAVAERNAEAAAEAKELAFHGSLVRIKISGPQEVPCVSTTIPAACAFPSSWTLPATGNSRPFPSRKSTTVPTPWRSKPPRRTRSE